MKEKIRCMYLWGFVRRTADEYVEVVIVLEPLERSVVKVLKSVYKSGDHKTSNLKRTKLSGW